MSDFSNDDHAAPKWLQAGYVGAVFIVLGLNAVNKLSSEDTQPFTQAWVSSSLTNSWEAATSWFPEENTDIKALIASFPKLRNEIPSQP